MSTLQLCNGAPADLFDLILYVPSTIFQLYRDRSSWVEPVLSWDKCVLLKDHNTVMPVRLQPAALWSGLKHSTTEHPKEPQLSITKTFKNYQTTCLKDDCLKCMHEQGRQVTSF